MSFGSLYTIHDPLCLAEHCTFPDGSSAPCSSQGRFALVAMPVAFRLTLPAGVWDVHQHCENHRKLAASTIRYNSAIPCQKGHPMSSNNPVFSLIRLKGNDSNGQPPPVRRPTWPLPPQLVWPKQEILPEPGAHGENP